MKPNFADSYKITALTIILGTLAAAPVKSQPITPANDGTNTTVTPQGNQFNIEGGTRSGANLFHSFDKFNVNSGQTANFMTTPDTSNILGRVTGGNASYVNGLIQVIGGNSNLFLMNPAGIMFGPNASLNIPTSFSVTTATGIGFDSNNYWFKAMGTNDYGNLVGDPSGYSFNVSNPGAIVNEGNLSLNPGENLTLLGGTVINTRELSTAGGNITISAVEGGSTLRISQPGHLLSLEVGTLHTTSLQNGENISEFNPLSLPQLLTGGEDTHASSVIVNANGEIVLTDSNTLVEVGDIHLANLTTNGGAISIQGGGNITTTSIDSSSSDGDGGNVEIQAVGNISTAEIITDAGEFVLNESGYVEETSGSGNAGNIRIETTEGSIDTTAGSFLARSVSGNGGNVEITAAENITTADITTYSHAQNSGNITIESTAGAIDITEGLNTSSFDGNGGNIQIKAAGDITTSGITTQSNQNAGNINIESTAGTIDTTAKFNGEFGGFVRALSGDGNGGNIEIKAAGDITTADITAASETQAGNITIESTTGTITAQDKIDARGRNNGGNIEIKAAGDITTTTIATSAEENAGNITIESTTGTITIESTLEDKIDARGKNNGGEIQIKAAEDITTISIATSAEENAGDITIESTAGAIDTTSGFVVASSDDGDGGDIQMRAVGNISTADITTDSGEFDFGTTISGFEILQDAKFGSGNAGNIIIETIAGYIDTTAGSVESRSVSGNGGNITMTAGGDIKTRQVESFSSSISERSSGNGGDITMTAGGDIINTEWLDASFADTSNSGVDLERENGRDGGNISLSAEGDIIAGWLYSFSFTQEGNSGDAGNITLTANGNINTYSFDSFSFTQEGKSGNGGDIILAANGNISFNTKTPFAENDAQDPLNHSFLGIDPSFLDIDPRGFANPLNDSSIKLLEPPSVGAPGLTSPDVIGQQLSQLDALGIRTFSVGTLGTNEPGNSGDVNITANNVSNTEIFTLSSHSQSGQVTIESQPQGNLELNNLSIITSKQVNTQVPFQGEVIIDLLDTQGQSGPVSIVSNGNLNLNNVTIESDTKGDQPAGNVNITSQGTITFDNSNILSITNAQGNAGEITLQTPQDIEFTNNSTLEADTQGTGKAGNINIEAGTLNLNQNTRLTTETSSAGAPGQINIKANSIDIGENAQISATVTAESTNTEGGGNIDIFANTLNISGNLGIFAETAGLADAGTLTIKTYNDNPNVDINFSNDGFISASTTSIGKGGNIFISSPETIGISGNGKIIVETEGRGNAGDININTGSLEVSNGAKISASTKGKGDAGNINITAQDSILFNRVSTDDTQRSGAFSNVQVGAEGDGGSVTITTGSLEVKNGAEISARTLGNGNAGNINITAEDTVIFDGVYHGVDQDLRSGAFSSVQREAVGNAGDVNIKTGSLEVKNGAEISAITDGNGDAGNVEITATDRVLLDGVSPDGSSRAGVVTLVRPEAVGNAGDITIQTGSLEVKNGGLISSETFGKGDARNVEITATDTVLFDGVFKNSRSGAFSSVREGAVGDAGDVNITTGSLEVKNGAEISASTLENGDAGSVEITATDSILLDGVSPDGSLRAGVVTLVGPEAVGNAGDITIQTGSLEVKNGGLISSETFGQGGKGDVGDVIITATDTVLFDGVSSIGRFSGVFSSVRQGAVGDAGDVSITTGSLEVTNGARISSSTLGKGDAGNIFITTNSQLTINENAQISAFTETQGNGGNIIITAPENLNITGNGQMTVSSGGAGNAGIIEIISPNITLSDGIDINAFTTGPGNAGNINLEGDNINIEPNTKILAFTETEGNGGNITVKAEETVNLGVDSQLSVETNNAGKAGNIEIATPQLTIGANAQISATVNIGASSTEPGGNITINTNKLDIAGELGIFAETEATADAGSLTLSPYKTNPNLDITFTNDGFISASTSSTGNGGNINISAPETINIQGNGFIAVETTDIGNAGTINMDTQNLTLSDKVAISASTEDKGDAGTININTNNLTLETGTSLTTETNSAGKAGNIEITTQKLTIGEDAQISATARERSTNTEAGGNITINATELFISGRLGIFAETTGESPAGSLSLNPYRKVGDQIGEFEPNLNITFTENGFISARTTSIGDGGNINIFAPENINISGEGRITVETEGSGDAGIISIETENLTIAKNTTISAATSNSGEGGSINITPSQTFQLEGQILTETTGTGNGGKISINTGKMMAPNSTISAKSTDAGNAGAIEITAQENLTTGIITSEANNTSETADGGNISITSKQGEINTTQPIQSFSEGANAGDVTLQAKTDITTNTISSHGQQQGGQITITAETGNINTSNGEFLANYSGGGDGGNVTIIAPTGDITTSDIYSFADSDGGQITLNAGNNINITENSNIISASEPPTNNNTDNSGTGGDIILEAGNNINTTTARIYSGADDGNTGKVNIIAENAIETGQIDLASGFVREEIPVNNNFTLIPVPQGEATQGVAGDITLRSNNSTIDTTAGTINSRSPDGSGDISLNARENITTGKLEASALNETKPTTGGDISITSLQAQINATEAIETFSERGTAGNVNIIAEGSVNIENILSQGTQRGGNITIDSRSENSINAQGALNTFSTEGIAGDVNLTSPGNITINGIRSEGMQQGGTLRVESEIGEITSTENIDSFSEQGIGGDVLLNASESVNLANVSSFGATESGDLIIQSRTASVNTGNVTTQAPAGSSGSIVINGEEVGTGDLSSIGTTSAGEINVEATDGSITTYDIEISSDGTIGDLILRATEDITTENINQNAGEGDANINIESGEDITTGDINQTAENDTNNFQIAEGDLTTGDINQTAENDTNNFQIAEGDLTTGDITQTAGNDATNIQTAGGNQNIGNVTQTAGNDATNIQTAGGNQNIGNITQTAGNDATNIQTAGGNQNIGNVTQTAGNNTNNIQTAGGQQNLGQINQTFGNESINIQLPVINQNVDNSSVISNNNTPIINQFLNEVNPDNNNNTNIQNNLTNNTNLLNQTANNNNPTINPSATNNLLNSITSNLISTATPSNNNQTINTPTAQYQRPEYINHTTDTDKIFKRIDSVHTHPLTVATGSNQVVTMLEQNRTNEYSNYFGTDFNEEFLSTKNVRDILKDMASQTGKESAVIYINAYQDQLQIILYTKSGQPIIKTIPEAKRKKLMKSVLKLRGQITNPSRRYTDSYLPPAQQLYDWLIAPIEPELAAANIDTLLFSMDEGLRTLPVAALHDGEEFLIEKYSLSLIPSVSLMDTNYRPLQDTKVLTMGASKFMEKEPLPAVPVEIQTISEKLWQGNMFLNENFTRNNLLTQRQNYPYPIIHLATHADFLPGIASNSYIQLWGSEQIKLDQIRELGWSQPAVDLLVLSACRTAFGDKNAELGFAGLAVAAGVKSALASVWYVSDEGTLGLMTEFYTHLNNAKIKAEALRQAQLAMLRGEVVIADGELRGSGARGSVVLPSILADMKNQDLSHPYYWAGFTMVGSPW